MTVLILTPLPLEYAAVAKHLERKQEVLYNGGAAYEVGHFVGKHDTYKIVLCEPGIKNVDMAIATEKAIQCFQPHIVLLIGIAGGVKDVKIGDVLIAKKVYGYESGKEDADGFKARPAVESFSRELLARVQVLSRRDDWKKRTDDGAPDAKVFIGPIAAGDKVVAGTNNPTFQRIKNHYNDTLGLEMEAIGFATALQGHPLEGLAIRGISDLCEDKAETNKENWQLVAAERAAAFAFELLYELDASQFVNLAVSDKAPSKHQKNLDFSAASTQLFLKKVEPDLLQETIARSEIPWQEIDQFFENPQKRILFIYGSGETGKTHLLRDLIESAVGKKWHTCAIERPVTESFADSLPKERPVLLFKDDIDREKDEFLLPVLQLIDSNPNLRLVLTADLAYRQKFNGEVEKIKDLTGKIYQVRLRSWPSEDLIDILRKAAKMNTVPHEEDIVRQFPNPYLLKYFGEVKSGSPALDIHDISKNFAVKIRHAFERIAFPTFTSGQVQSLILEVVFQTLQIENTSLDLYAVLTRLEENDVVHRRQGSWCIFPTVKGELYLACQIQDKSESEFKSLLEPYLDADLQATINKVIHAAQYVSNKDQLTLSSCLSNVVTSWAKKIDTNPEFLQPHHVKSATHILNLEKYGYGHSTDVACDFVIEVITSAIPKKSQNEANLPIRDDGWPSLTGIKQEQVFLDDIAIFLQNLLHIPRKRGEYLGVLQELWSQSAAFGNVISESLLTNAFKPVSPYNDNDYKSLKIGIEYVRYWLIESDNPIHRQMAVKALGVMLGGFFEVIREEHYSTVLLTKGLPNSPLLFEIRSCAIDIIFEAITIEDLKLEALNVISNIGLKGRPKGYEIMSTLPSYPKVQQEIERCIPVVGEALCNSDQFLIQKECESILLNWWLLGISENMEYWLLKFNRTPEYLFYRTVFNAGFIVDDFAQIKSQAPLEGRRKWYWQSCAAVSKQGVSRYKPLIERFLQIYNSPIKIAQLINEISVMAMTWRRTDGRVPDYSLYSLSEVVQCWTEVTPEYFSQILLSPEMLRLLPDVVQIGIKSQLAVSSPNQAHDFAKAILAKLPHATPLEINRLIWLLKHHPHEKENWLQQVIEQAGELMLNELAFFLDALFSPETEIDKIAEYMLRILNTDRVAGETFFKQSSGALPIYGLLFSRRNSLPKEVDEQIRQKTFDLIKKISSLDQYMVQVFAYSVRNITHLIDLIDYRADYWDTQRMKENTYIYRTKTFPEVSFSQEDLQGVFQNADNHRIFIDKIRGWEAKVGAYSPNWKNQYIDLVDPETNQPWIENHLKDALAKNDLDRAEIYSHYMPCEEIYISLMLQVWQKISLHRRNDEYLESLLNNWLDQKGRSDEFNGRWHRYDSQKQIWKAVLNRPMDLRLKKIAKKVDERLDLLLNWEKEHLH